MSETPETKRERQRKEELKNASSSIHGGNLADLVGSFGWKATGLLIIIIILGFIIVSILSN
ncbi:DUF6366 family protein [Amphibacillus sp. Q70]|uniref:DUF6366 family protein n=1 Tax=Amphibacillus sp. Q70 TaxID=3453416 RepID=UPI003F8369D0